MNYPGSEPAEFVVAATESADECYVTVLLRNGRVRQVGGTAERPVLVRSFITGDEWRAIVDDLLDRLKDAVDGLSLRCVAEGFDPGMYPADDKEAIDSAEVHALVVAVPPGGQEDVRRVVTGFAAERELQATWLLVAPPSDPAIRATSGPSEAAPTPEELRKADCWFASDAVPRDKAATDFRRRARLHQARWRQAKNLPGGFSPYGAGPGAKPVGSRIERTAARDKGANFVTPAALDAVRHRLSYREDHQMLNEDRLWCDLLSSMPMCFNVFGPVSGDLERADRAVKAWWPDTPGQVADVKFEWSPGRLDRNYLGNRSAFDVAFLLDLPDGRRGVIGVETKYQEHPIVENRPSDERLPRYLEVSEQSGAFTVDVQTEIVATDLQQVWLDHLLALSMLQHPDGQWGWARFVIVYPEHNPGFTDAVARYRRVIDGTAFASTTLETLLGNIEVFEEGERAVLRERYLW